VQLLDGRFGLPCLCFQMTTFAVNAIPS
jgi:hypothetical protein